MSYTAPDFSDDAVAILEEFGYSFHDNSTVDEESYSWSFGGYTGASFNSAHLAHINALRDSFSRFGLLQMCAARVVGRWERGNLAESVRSLHGALDSSVPGDVSKFIKDHS